MVDRSNAITIRIEMTMATMGAGLMKNFDMVNRLSPAAV